MRHVGRGNVTPFLEIMDGSDDVGKKRGKCPRREFVDAGEKERTNIIHIKYGGSGWRLTCLV
jgi:hypothetical protein